MKKEDYMLRAINLAKKAKFHTNPNPRVGCIIVKNNKVIGEGYHKKYGGAHAEVNAVNNCLKKFGSKKGKQLLRDSQVYVTLEPCSIKSKTPPCTNTLLEIMPKEVYCASLDPNKKINGNGVKILRKSGIKVEVGILKKQAIEMNKDFFFKHKNGKPYVRVKIAQTIDGKIALKNGKSKWITSKEARKNVQLLRIQNDAVLIGSNTLIKDNPRLNIRDVKVFKQPISIVLGNTHSAKKNMNIFKDNKKVIFANNYEKTELNQNFTNNLSFIKLTKKNSLNDLLKKLSKYDLNSILVEGGSKIFTSFISKNLADEIIFYISPKFLGKDSIDALSLESPLSIANTNNYIIDSTEMVGEDIKLVLKKN